MTNAEPLDSRMNICTFRNVLKIFFSLIFMYMMKTSINPLYKPEILSWNKLDLNQKELLFIIIIILHLVNSALSNYM